MTAFEEADNRATTANVTNYKDSNSQQQAEDAFPAYDSEYQGKSNKKDSMAKRASENFTGSEVHQFYQDLFLTDMKGEIYQAKEEVEVFRKRANKAEEEILELKKENKRLKSSVEMYRNMVLE